MCGIAGIIGPFNQIVLKDKIVKMAARLIHRGPDSDGFYFNEKIALVNTRLAIIDLNDNANQPFIDSQKRYVLLFNGEIYNFREVKSQLADYDFTSHSDTEVVLAAFMKWGPKCLERLNGMFAFAIWDNQKRQLFIARDRLGAKPLYYYHFHDRFIFASEIRAINASGLVQLEVDDDSLADYLMNLSVTAPNTLFKEIHQLMPGQYAVFKDNTLTKSYYWNIEAARTFHDLDDLFHVEKEIRRLLTESVERRMISDVDLGAFLSGGIDSSAIVGLMSEVTDKPVHTFSVAFNEQTFDESHYAKLIARKFNTKHTQVNLTAGDFLKELPNALSAIDTPSGDAINTYIIAKATKNAGFSVALSGIGGDELFAGYDKFKLFYKIKNHPLLRSAPEFMRQSAGTIARHLLRGAKGERFAGMLKAENLNIEHQYTFLRQSYPMSAVKRMLRNQHPIGNMVQEILAERKIGINKLPVLSQYSVAELLCYTQNVLLKDTDQMGMANSLEIREPFLDYHLVEFVLQIPDQIKFPIYPKSLLVEALYPLLPFEIVHRPKMGFTFPWIQWLQNELRDFCELHLRLLGKREQFSASEISRLWNDFLGNKNGVKWNHIWQLVVLESYLTENLGQ
ncbi:MAG: asparagine synthase (glutamine-hydrolyzing) [Mucilaginibacter sp.]